MWTPEIMHRLIALGAVLLLSAASVEASSPGHGAAGLGRPGDILVVATATPEAGHAFPATGKTVSGIFLTYWQQQGALAQYGYPISDEFTETSALNGRVYLIQYFERAVFEYHPEYAPPFEVLLSQLGRLQYRQKYPHGAPGQQASTQRPRRFAETGMILGGRFRDYWEQHGGLAQQGYPISDEFTETSDLNGQPYRVQYFERAVFEYHPEYAPPYDVLLVQLGTLRYREKYPQGAPREQASGAIVDLPTGCLLGGVQQGQWASPAAIAAQLHGGEVYQLYSLTARLGQASGGVPRTAGPPCPALTQIRITSAPGTATLAIAGRWNIQPRIPQVERTDQEVYRQAASTVLTGLGMHNPRVRLTQVVRVDLVGDGTTEVLVNATDQRDARAPRATAGDYSVVFLRTLVAGRVQTVVLASDYHLQAEEFRPPWTYTVSSLLDLNGDGVLEVSVAGTYYEGVWAAVYAIQGIRVAPVLSCGCRE